MDKSKSQNSKKLINSKLLYTLPLASVGLCFTQQSVNAMFKSSLAFFRNLEQKSSTSKTLTPLTRPSTSSTPTTGKFFTNSRGFRVPIQTSSNLETRPKTTTSAQSTSTSTPSTSTAGLGVRPKTSSSISTQPTSSGSKKQESMKSSSPYAENSIEDSVKRALTDVLTNRVNTQSFSPEEDPRDNVILNNLKRNVYDLSLNTFNNEVRNHLISKNIPLSTDIEKNIDESSKNFGNHVMNLAAYSFKSGIKHFDILTSPANSDLTDQGFSVSTIPNMYSNSFKDSVNNALKISVDVFTSSLK